MAAEKYLKNNGGIVQEVSATQTSTGVSEAGKIVALDDTGRLDSSLMPVGIGAETDTITASENLAAGDLVNIWTSTGAKARKADATSAGKYADGFVLASVTSGQPATVYRSSQTITGLTGLTAGATYYLDTTAGGITATAPTGSGNVQQIVGKAISTSELRFEPYPPIILA